MRSARRRPGSGRTSASSGFMWRGSRLNRQPVAKVSFGPDGSGGLTLAAAGEEDRERNGDQPPAGRVNAAEDASKAKDWPRAAELWEGLRREFPRHSRYWGKAGEACCEAGLVDRAEQLLAEALTLFPTDPWVPYFYAMVARRRKDWPAYLSRAERLRDGFSRSFAWLGRSRRGAIRPRSQAGSKSPASRRRRSGFPTNSGRISGPPGRMRKPPMPPAR